VHRITDTRMAAIPHRNLLMFAELCGPRGAENVVLATTMWDKLGCIIHELEREQELKLKYWNAMIHHGAAVERFLNNSDSAWRIIDNIFNRNEDSQKKGLRFQEERVDEKKHFKETGAGQALSLELPLLIEKQNKRMLQPAEWNNPHESVAHGAQESEYVIFPNT